MPKCRGKKEWTKHVNNTGRRSRACQLQAAQKASVVADDLGTDTGNLLRLQPGDVTVTPVSVSDDVIGTALLTVHCLNVSTISSK